MEVMSPPTPKPFGQYYFSAPTSPSHLSQLIYQDHHFEASSNNNGDDFAFHVSQEWDQASSSAEELFDNGVIKPLTPPPPHRGRERRTSLSKKSSRRAVRSLSPVRDTQYAWQEQEAEQQQEQDADHDQSMTSKPPITSSTSGVRSTLVAYTKLGHYKKWSLKDLFLFRSASEGRAAEKDPLKKYTAAIWRSSSQAVEGPVQGGSGSGSRRKGPVSAHELHYTVNRAVSEDLKKKTFLPYKQGILGRLAFNPAVHALANGFGFSRK